MRLLALTLAAVLAAPAGADPPAEPSALGGLVEAMREEFVRLDREAGDPSADARRRLREIAIILAELDAPAEAQVAAIRLARARGAIDAWITAASRSEVPPSERRRVEWTRLLLRRFAAAPLDRLHRVGSPKGGDLDRAVAETLGPLLEAIAAYETAEPRSHFPPLPAPRSASGSTARAAAPDSPAWSPSLREAFEAWRTRSSDAPAARIDAVVRALDEITRASTPWLDPLGRAGLEAWAARVLASRDTEPASILEPVAAFLAAVERVVALTPEESRASFAAGLASWIPAAEDSSIRSGFGVVTSLLATIAESRAILVVEVDPALRAIRDALDRRRATEESIALRRLQAPASSDPVEAERDLVASLTALRTLRADLARVRDLSAWLDRIRVDSPRLANAAGRRARTLAADLNTSDSRRAAGRAIDRLIEESPLAEVPHERALVDGGVRLPSELGVVRVEIVARLTDQRWRWLEAWCIDRDDEADQLWRSTRLLRSILEVAFALPVVASEEQVPLARRLARWGAWSVDPAVVAAAVSALGPRVRLALHAWLRGDFDAVERHLEGWRREAPLALAAIELDAAIGSSLAQLPDGVLGAVEAVAIAPTAEAFLPGGRALLARISRRLVEIPSPVPAGGEPGADRSVALHADLAVLLEAIRRADPAAAEEGEGE